MTITRPLRRITLHFSHMGFTDGLTFIVLNHSFQRFVSNSFARGSLLAAPGDPAAGQVIGRHLHGDLIAGQNPDEIHSEFSGNMRQNCVTISNVNLERCIGQSFYHNTFHFDHIGFCQTLSLLVRLDFLAKNCEGPAKFTIGDFVSAFICKLEVVTFGSILLNNTDDLTLRYRFWQ